MGKIRKIGLFPNDNEKSLLVANELKGKLNNYGYIVDNSDFDLAIAVGGDGSFLRMVKQCSFDEDIYYIGVNTGTLGFAQEIYPQSMDDFIQKLSEENYKIEEIGALRTEICTEQSVCEKTSLNEIIIRESRLKKLQLKLRVNEELLGRFIGDGLLIATSFGSTAHNRSYNGSIVYNELHTLQITPMGPIDSESYRSLRNSIVMPEERNVRIILYEETKNISLDSDGEIEYFDNVQYIKSSVKKKIKCLKMSDYDYTKKINEKLVK